jgi:hypothetical protein
VYHSIDIFLPNDVTDLPSPIIDDMMLIRQVLSHLEAE